jgi:hypothetical protein
MASVTYNGFAVATTTSGSSSLACNSALTVNTGDRIDVVVQLNLIYLSDLSVSDNLGNTYVYAGSQFTFVAYTATTIPTAASITAAVAGSSTLVTFNSAAASNPFAVGQYLYFTAAGGITGLDGNIGQVTAIGGVTSAWTVTVNLSTGGSYTTGGTVSASSILLTGNWAYASGTYEMQLSATQQVYATFVNGSNVVTWPGGLSATTTTSLKVAYNSSAYQSLAFYYCLNAIGGSATITASNSYSAVIINVYAQNFSPVGAVWGSFAGFSAFTIATNSSVTSINSGLISLPTVPVHMMGFCADIQSGAIPATVTAGSGFTSRNAVWLAGTDTAAPALAEDQYITTGAPQSLAATFGVPSQIEFDTFVMGAMAFNLNPTPPYVFYRKNVLYFI